YPAGSGVVDNPRMARYVAIPIVPGTRPIGAVGMAWDEDPGIDEPTRAHLQDLVDAGAQGLGRARLEDAERRTRFLLRAIVDQIPLGILILEPDGTRPPYMNRKFGELFSVPSPGGGAPATMLR